MKQYRHDHTRLTLLSVHENWVRRTLDITQTVAFWDNGSTVLSQKSTIVDGGSYRLVWNDDGSASTINRKAWQQTCNRLSACRS